MVAKISSRACHFDPSLIVELLLFSRRSFTLRLRYGDIFLRHIYVVALAALIKQIIAGLCEVVHTLPTLKVPMNTRGTESTRPHSESKANIGKETSDV